MSTRDVSWRSYRELTKEEAKRQEADPKPRAREGEAQDLESAGS